jgi:transglutaminase-like putative cysteine protease
MSHPGLLAPTLVEPGAAAAAPRAPTGAAIPLPTQRWVLAGLLGAVLLNAGHAAPWCLPLAAAAVAWRTWAGGRGARLMRPMLRIGVAALLTLAVLISFRTLNGVDAGASLLVAMVAVKLTETRGERDWLIVLGSALFLLLAACLSDQSLWRTPLYAAELWLLCSGMYALGAVATAPATSPPSGAPLLRASARSLLLALPLAVVLFLFFPRLPGSLWVVPREEQAVTGLGDELEPGSITQLTDSDEPAMRVRFDGPAPPRAERYWRGPVLHLFDGFAWSRLRQDLGQPPPLEFAGRPFRYEVTLEANRHGVLLGLDLPAGVPPAPVARIGFDRQLLAAAHGPGAATYRLESFLQHRATGPLSPAQRRLDLQLPAGRNPRSLELAHELRARAPDDRAYVQAVLAYLRDNHFEYTRTPPRLGRDSIDELLFRTHQGFCGHYASAFALLMRAGGVPARVVTGYFGGEWNRFGAYLLIRQSDAHAWTETWLPGEGWLRVDPTAAVAPQRISGAPGEAAAGAGAAGGPLRAAPWVGSALQAWQAMNAWWQDQILHFDLTRQLDLLGRLGFRDRDYQGLVGLLAAGGTIWLSLLAWRERRRGAAPAPDALGRQWRRLERALARRGAVRRPHEGVRSFGERIGQEQPELAVGFGPLARRYLQLRFGRHCEPAELAGFERAVRSFILALRHARA